MLLDAVGFLEADEETLIVCLKVIANASAFPTSNDPEWRLMPGLMPVMHAFRQGAFMPAGD